MTGTGSDVHGRYRKSAEDPIIAGDTADDWTTEVEMQTKFRDQLLSLQDIKQGLSHTPVFAVLSHMQNRYSTNPCGISRGLGISALVWGDTSIL